MDLEVKPRKRKLFACQDLNQDESIDESDQRITKVKQDIFEDAFLTIMLKETIDGNYILCNDLMNSLETVQTQINVCIKVILAIIKEGSTPKKSFSGEHLESWCDVLRKICDGDTYFKYVCMLVEDWMKTPSRFGLTELMVYQDCQQYWLQNYKLTQKQFISILCKENDFDFSHLLGEFVLIGFQITEDTFHELIERCINEKLVARGIKHAKNVQRNVKNVLRTAIEQHPYFTLPFETVWKAALREKYQCNFADSLLNKCEIIDLTQFKQLLKRVIEREEAMNEEYANIPTLFRMKTSIDIQAYKNICFDLLMNHPRKLGEDNVAFIREELENFIRIESMPSVIIKNIKDIFPDDVISLILVYCTGSVVETIQNKANAQIRHEIKHTV